MRAAVPLAVRKTTQATAKQKLASMRQTSHLITALQLSSYLLSQIVAGLCHVADVAQNRNAASRFEYGQADKPCNDLLASSPPLQVTTTALV